MSKIARKPLLIPAGVQVKLDGANLNIKGPNGSFDWSVCRGIQVVVADQQISVILLPEFSSDKAVRSMLGTTQIMLSNMLVGVTTGFEKALKLIGVGYRGSVKGKVLDLTLGYSHSVQYAIPEGISIVMPSNTELVIKGSSKEQVGQVAAEIRRLRPPESYKGKGIRYADEQVILKETKKK